MAIRLRSLLTGREDYILELFLPHFETLDERPITAYTSLLNAVSATIKQVSRSLRTVTAQEIAEESGNSSQSNSSSAIEAILQNGSIPPEFLSFFGQNLTYTAHDDKQNGGHFSVSRENFSSQNLGELGRLLEGCGGLEKRMCETDPREEERRDESRRKVGKNIDVGEESEEESEDEQEEGEIKEKGDGIDGDEGDKKKKKKGAGNEKIVPFSVIQQHFTKSLKDAAKCIGGKIPGL